MVSRLVPVKVLLGTTMSVYSLNTGEVALGGAYDGESVPVSVESLLSVS